MRDDEGRGGGILERILFLASPVFYLSRSLVSLTGVVLTTSAFFTIIVLLVLDFYHTRSNPYIGIPAYLILPGIFVAGLVLIAAGMLGMRRRQIRSGLLPARYPSWISTCPASGWDGDHATANGEVISQDYGIRHTVLAFEEDNPEILSVITPGGL